MAPGGDSLAHICPRCHFDHGGERTGKSHRFMMAVVAAAYANWPHAHNHAPTSAAHLRAWLFCHDAVRYCSEIDAAPEGVAAIEAMLEAVRLGGGYAFVVPDERGAKLRLRIPRSAALKKNGGELTAGPFYALLDRLLAAIEQETGITRQDLRREGLAAVAARPKLGKRMTA